MSLAALPQQAQAPLGVAGDALRFLRALYGTQEGYAELSCIDGDPRYVTKKLATYHKAGYYQWPRQAQELAADAAHYGAVYGNVYVSSGLYRTKNRKEPLPSRIVFLDDAPEAPALPYSAIVQTSAASRHGYYLVDRLLTPDERRDLQRRAAAANSSDASGADVEQIVRVPGTFNTKGHGRFPVALVRLDGPRYTAEQLRAAWPAVPERTRRRSTDASGDLGDEPWQRRAWRDELNKAAQPWRDELEPGGLLLNAAGLPRRMTNPTTIARRILDDETHFYSKSGNWDASLDRYIVIKALMLHGYAQIAAMAEHLADFGVEVKGPDAIWIDICRCIYLLADELGDKRRITPVSFRPKSRARVDRPEVLGDDEDVLVKLGPLQHTPGKISYDRKELAAALGVSVPTLDRHLKPLRDKGLIAWVRYARHQHSYLWLSDGAQMMIAHVSATSAEKPSTDVLSGTTEYGALTPQIAVSPQRRNTERASAALAAPAVEAAPPERGCGVCPAPEAAPAAEAIPTSPAPLQDIDISRERGSAAEARMAAVYRAQGEQVRIIPREEQRNGRGDLECTRPDGITLYREVKGEREYPGRCAAIEFQTVPLNRVAYGGASGPAESRADTFVYMNTTSGQWWELDVATVRALLPAWRARFRVVDGVVNERETPYGHARYHTRCVLVPQVELARHAIAQGMAPNPLAEACAHIRRLYPGRKLATLVQLVCDNVPGADADAVRAELERQRAAAALEKRRTALERQCEKLAERARNWRLKVLEAKAKSYGSKAAEAQCAGKGGSAYVWRRLGGMLEAEIVRRCDVAAEDEAIDAEVALVEDRRQHPRTLERPADAPTRRDTTPTPSVAPGAAGESTGPNYSVDGVLMSDGRVAWRVWDDAADAVVATFATERVAEGYARRLLQARARMAIAA